MTAAEALDRLEKIADIVDDLAYAVGCGLEGTRTAKNIREAVTTIREAIVKLEDDYKIVAQAAQELALRASDNPPRLDAWERLNALGGLLGGSPSPRLRRG